MTVRFTRLVAVLLLAFSVVSFAQTKDARDKYVKARRELDKAMNGPNCPPRKPCYATPPNLDKAEKWLKEAVAASPDYIDAQVALGDVNHIQRRVEAAASEYGKARDLDDKQKKLSRADRDNLLDQLGLAQAQARHFDEAIKTYTAAVGENPEYPLFEYNLACSYAEKGNLDAAIPHLQKAWALRDKMPEGQPFPDPRKDDSFKRYWHDEKFQAAVENMVI